MREDFGLRRSFLGEGIVWDFVYIDRALIMP
jgi:hypothetical protein